MNLQLIRKFSEKRAGGLKKLAIDCGMSEQNLHRCINNNRIQARDLETIAGLLGVSVGTFFGEEPQQPTNKYESLGGGHVHMTEENLLLEDKIRILEQLIQEKERTIQILMSK